MGSLRRSSIALLAALLLAGCGGTRTVTVTVSTTTRAAPPAPISLGVPAGYRAKSVLRFDLTGGPVPEVVVTSVGPPVTALGFHSADLRVLAWDPLARRWSVAFDAQKVVPPDTIALPSNSNLGPGSAAYPTSPDDRHPLLDPKADVTLGPVRAGRLLPGSRKQLVFSAAWNYGGSGVPSVLAVVDLQGGVANLVYAWGGEGLATWKIGSGRLEGRSWYWTPSDAHCCPERSYGFAVRWRAGMLTEVADDRPWVGATVRPLGKDDLFGPLVVTELADRPPAGNRLRVGDVILDVRNAPPPPKGADPSASASIFDKLTRLHAGQVAELVVRRGATRVVVPVKLGSMKDSNRQFLPDDFSRQGL